MVEVVVRKEEFPPKDLLEGLERVKEDIKANRQIPLWIRSDPRIFELERIKLWPRVWHFLAHESEIPNPGDFVRRYIGPDVPVVVVRGDDGKVRAFLNICRHRGRQFCVAEAGKTSQFMCPYHGWTYNTKGELINVPFKDLLFPEDFNPKDYGLYEVRIESYNGLIFGNLSGKKAESLEEYLGDFAWYLDILTKRTDKGLEFYVPQRWIANFNWKEGADNFHNDSYHLITTHQSARYLGLIVPGGNPVLGYFIASRKGHGIGIKGEYKGKIPEIYYPAGYRIFAPEVVEMAKKNLTPEQFKFWYENHIFLHGTVFPNFSFLDVLIGRQRDDYVGPAWKLFRLWRPISPTKTEVWGWFAVEADANEEFKRLSYRNYLQNFGPGGMFEVDDIENWETIGANSQSLSVNSAADIKFPYIMGKELMLNETPHKAKYGDLDIAPINNDRQLRNRWLRYIEYLLS